MFVHNTRYAATNTAKSLLCALPKFDDDVMWVNGDLYFEEPAVRLLLEQQTDCSRTLVDHSKTGDEEIKYTIFPDGSIDQISKTVERPAALGESLGLQIVTRRDRARLQRALEAVGEKDYFERALELCTQDRSIRLMPVDVGGSSAWKWISRKTWRRCGSTSRRRTCENRRPRPAPRGRSAKRRQTPPVNPH